MSLPGTRSTCLLDNRTAMLGTRREPQRTPLERIGARTIPIVVIFAITVILLWKIALTSQYTWINGPDYVNQVVPWFQFQAREWHAHRFPLWDPYHWGGQPLVGQDQPGAMYPLNWILSVSYTHLRAHETRHDLVCRL